MSIQNSNLAKYGYDMVVAVTQKALNNTIKTYYSKNATAFTEQQCYFIKDASGNPVAVDQASLLAQTNNIDPLSSKTTSNQFTSLLSTPFYFAFKFTPGDPGGINNFTYLSVNPGTDSVVYWLLCKDVQIVFWNPDTKVWVNVTQSRTNEFNINTTINLQNILDNTNLTPAVQAQVNNLGNTDVNVQQLLFDFDSAVVNPTTSLPGLDPKSSVFKPVMQQFAASYFNAYAAVEVPRLNYAVTQSNASSLIPTGMKFYADAINDANGNPVVSNPTLSQADLSTINYLFSVDGDTLPAPAQFSWNWLEDNGVSPTPDLDPNADVNLYNGAISINRDAFAKYLDSQLTPYVMQNWFVPIVVPIYTDYGQKDNADAFSVSFQSITSIPDGFQSYNGAPYTADNLVHWTNSQNVSAQGKVNAANTMTVECYFDISFSVYAGQAALAQTMEIIVNETYNNTNYGGTAILIQARDVFELVLDDTGNLLFQKIPAQSYFVNTPQNITLYGEDNGWLQTWLQAVTAKSFEDIPVIMPQQFVFPGGDAFTFQDAQFSDVSDIVCHVTYKSE